MSDIKIVREWVNLDEQTVLDVDTLETRALTAEEQDKINIILK